MRSRDLSYGGVGGIVWACRETYGYREDRWHWISRTTPLGGLSISATALAMGLLGSLSRVFLFLGVLAVSDLFILSVYRFRPFEASSVHRVNKLQTVVFSCRYFFFLRELRSNGGIQLFFF